MKHFSQLTTPGKIRRIRQLANAALDNYPLSNPEIRFIQHGENTTFRVNAVGPDRNGLRLGRQTYLLRVHRTGYQDETSVQSELAWLTALSGAGLIVPTPVAAMGGSPLVSVRVPGVPEPRMCSLLHWIHGRFWSEPSPGRFRKLGELMARLHSHTEAWKPPAGFERRRWDWEGLFGNDAGFHGAADEVWSRLPQRVRSVCDSAATEMGRAIDGLGTHPDAYGLIHADLNLGNVLYSGGIAVPIDFDDCGYAHWMYDVCVPLADSVEEEAWSDLRDALLEGYRSVRPLPPGTEHLSSFMAGRLVSLLLWATDMARTNETFQENLDRWATWVLRSIERISALAVSRAL